MNNITTQLNKLSEFEVTHLQEGLSKFIDLSITASGRSTFYNTKEEQEAAEKLLHENLIKLDRGFYIASLLLPVQDRARQMGVLRLLNNEGERNLFFTPEEETQLIQFLCQKVNPSRFMDILTGLREVKINNSRSRKVGLSLLFNSSKLEWWSVKYRTKIAIALKHLWGQKMTGAIVSILRKSKTNQKEKDILSSYINNYVQDKNRIRDVYECVLFALGEHNYSYSLNILKAFQNAKTDITAGKLLPYEVLEGIRSTYHKNIKTKDILEATKKTLTTRQKLQKQSTAKKSDIAIDFNPEDYSLADLYIYAYKNGMSQQIFNAMEKRANEDAKNFVGWGKVGILLDCSLSSFGDETQKYRPIAIATSIRDTIVAATWDVFIELCGGKEKDHLLYPEGETNLADGLLNLVEQSPEIIFVISDGYENVSAGRFHQVIAALKKIKNNIPIIHINPVAATEAAGIRELSKEIETLPANNAASLQLSFLKNQLKNNFSQFAKTLLQPTKKLLTA